MAESRAGMMITAAAMLVSDGLLAVCGEGVSKDKASVLAHPSCVLMSAPLPALNGEVAKLAKEEPKYFACRRRKLATVRSFQVLGSEILDVECLHARRICDSSTRNEMRSCSAAVSHVSTNSSRDA